MSADVVQESQELLAFHLRLLLILAVRLVYEYLVSVFQLCSLLFFSIHILVKLPLSYLAQPA